MIRFVYKYYKVMFYFWILLTISTLMYITFKGMIEGFKMWAPYYFFSLIGLMMFFFNRFKLKRIEKQIQFLNEQEAKNNSLK